ncbi:hypothetical protein [Halomarina oriensis]|uniref:DUF8173 domain-containing protein n=1 Tax=Halomarina oriensis TaxID=671145 RepID=A0A6B0GL50_9EURY|nr:hypothetical protein [Halomarina oriensis]MWG35656.1 hypothetical protein [Halomarina oriensis]
MRLPSPTRPAALVGLSVAAVFALGLAATVSGSGVFGSYRWPVGYFIGMLVSLTLGVVVVHLAPDYVERITDELGDRPGEFFVYGLVSFAVFVVLAFVLGIAAVGILGFGLLVPLAVVVVVVAHAVVSTGLGGVLRPPRREPPR